MKPFTVSLGDAELTACERYARAAEIGGTSSVRTDDRAAALAEDQLVGQVATLAGSKWLYGSALGHYAYRMGRWAADRAPTVGDGGADVPGSNIDFKGSLIRNSALDHSKYRLAVRPKERHHGWVYVLALVEPGFKQVHLIGWAEDDDLPRQPDSDGAFAGAHTVMAPHLYPLPPFRWTL